MEYLPTIEEPEWVQIWPAGTIELEWLQEDFNVDLEVTKGTDDILLKDKPDRHRFSKAILRFLETSGWEAVEYRQDEIMFKRPIEDK